MGNIIRNESEIVEEIRNHFEKTYNSFNSPNSEVNRIMDEFCNDLTLPSLDDDDVLLCDAPVSEKEVANSIKSMQNGSTPGLDALPVEWYKVFWQYIKEPLMECYRYSFDADILCPTERVGVISLLHKGKDLPTDCLNSFRPLSLTNVDYKILAKTFSLRLNSVIDKLIGIQQKGFIKGRQISLIHRQIDDLLNIQRITNSEGMVVALDFKQAFDSVSSHCILKTLERFGFGNNFIKWVKILNTQRESCIKNGGHISSTFSMNNGVRQGCPISPQLFILVVEILAQKIIQDGTITGLNPHEGREPIKITQYADDATLFLKSINDFKKSLSHIDMFSLFSGLKLNMSKSYALSTNGSAIDTEGIHIEFKDKIKILGIYFSNCVQAGELEDNWTNRIGFIINILSKWTRRNLSIIGKIHILKTFALSQLNFVIQSISLPQRVLDQINQIFFRFMWKKRFDNKKAFEKIKRKVLYNDYNDGGLKMIDINRFQDSILLAWGESLICNESGTWQELALFFFKSLGGKIVFAGKSISASFKGSNLIRSCFWEKVLLRWIDNAENNKQTILSIHHPISNNELILYNRQPLFLPTAIRKGVVQIGDMMFNERLLTYNEFLNKYGPYPRSFLDFITMSTPLKMIMRNGIINHEFPFSFKGVFLGALGRKYFYSALHVTESPICNDIWSRKYRISLTSEHWNLIHEMKEVRLRALGWKILHNIYPTNILLFKMKLSENQNCKFCNELDYMEHFFFSCPKVLPLWQEIEKDVHAITGFRVKFEESMVLCGIISLPGVKSRTLKRINHFIALGRLVISKFKYGKSRSIIEIYETDCRSRKLKV